MPTLATMLAAGRIPISAPTTLPVAGACMPLSLIKQEHDNWCWASVMQGLVWAFMRFNGVPDHLVPQKHIASWLLGVPRFPRCVPTSADKTLDLKKSLRKLRWSKARHDRPPTRGLVGSLTGADAILCWIKWNSGGYHYVLVTGWASTPGELHVIVLDPLKGGDGDIMRYNALCHAYGGGNGEVALFMKVW